MANESDCKGAKILVVDDDGPSRLLASEILEEEGHEVVLAAGGIEGIAAFERERPACVLLDVRMPDMDGFEVCKKIRSLGGVPDTPVIFLTASRDLETFDAALRAGSDDFITKPFRPTELLVRVQTALKLRSAKVELAEHFDLLKRQRDDLIRLQLLKERLAAFVVHDLKSPVNAMDLRAQLVLQDLTLSAKVRASVNQIRAGTRQLNRMIMNLLDLSKADEGRISPRLADLEPGALVSRVFTEFEAVAKGHAVKLQSSISARSIRADEDLLSRLLANLVENAIRHSPPESAVTVTVTSRGESSEISVADAGSGVPAEMKERIFDPFVQADEGTASRNGRGLGLTFCKMVAEAHGGTIAVQNASPGAVFCVTVPAHA